LWRERIHQAGVLLTQVRNSAGAGSAGDMIEGWLHDQPPRNVWIGTTVEDQQRADERIPHLLNIPARVRFLSCEPLLGPVELGLAGSTAVAFPVGFGEWTEARRNQWFRDTARATVIARASNGIHQVIAGGESGPKARPMHPDWPRSLRDQCAAAGVPFLFKQWGEWCPGYSSGGYPMDLANGERFTVPDEDPHPSVHVWKATDDEGSFHGSARVGKKAAGRLLDGVLHDGFPQAEKGGAK